MQQYSLLDQNAGDCRRPTMFTLDREHGDHSPFKEMVSKAVSPAQALVFCSRRGLRPGRWARFTAI